MPTGTCAGSAALLALLALAAGCAALGGDRQREVAGRTVAWHADDLQRFARDAARSLVEAPAVAELVRPGGPGDGRLALFAEDWRGDERRAAAPRELLLRELLASGRFRLVDEGSPATLVLRGALAPVRGARAHSREWADGMSVTRRFLVELEAAPTGGGASAWGERSELREVTLVRYLPR